MLTGGGSTRLGRDKATTRVAGRRMIDRVLARIPAEVPVVVVGPDPQVRRRITVTREDPPGGGPAAGIGAALPHVHTELVAVVATDMPFGVDIVLELLDRLGWRDPAVPDAAVPGAAGPGAAGPGAAVPGAAVPVADGHPQPLSAVYRTEALRGLALRAGMSMREVLSGLAVEQVAASPDRVLDIDTPTDLAEVRRRLAIMEAREKGFAMQQWVDAVKEALGLDAEVDVDLVLDVAKDVAHGVKRPAAPVTTYLFGLAVAAGADPAQTAAKLGELAQGWQPESDV